MTRYILPPSNHFINLVGSTYYVNWPGLPAEINNIYRTTGIEDFDSCLQRLVDPFNAKVLRISGMQVKILFELEEDKIAFTLKYFKGV